MNGPAMNTKLMATIFFLGTLAIGVAAGIYFDRTLLRPRPPFQAYREFGGSPGPGSPMMRNFSRQLDLTPQQQAKLAQILENYRQSFGSFRRTMQPRYMAMRDSLNAEIRTILTPAQQQKFDEMIQRFEGRHKRMGQGP